MLMSIGTPRDWGRGKGRGLERAGIESTGVMRALRRNKFPTCSNT